MPFVFFSHLNATGNFEIDIGSILSNLRLAMVFINRLFIETTPSLTFKLLISLQLTNWYVLNKNTSLRWLLCEVVSAGLCLRKSGLESEEEKDRSSGEKILSQNRGSSWPACPPSWLSKPKPSMKVYLHRAERPILHKESHLDTQCMMFDLQICKTAVELDQLCLYTVVLSCNGSITSLLYRI